MTARFPILFGGLAVLTIAAGAYFMWSGGGGSDEADLIEAFEAALASTEAEAERLSPDTEGAGTDEPLGAGEPSITEPSQGTEPTPTAVPRAGTTTPPTTTPPPNQERSCITVGAKTSCSDGTWYTQVGSTVTGSDGTSCTVVANKATCYSPASEEESAAAPTPIAFTEGALGSGYVPIAPE